MKRIKRFNQFITAIYEVDTSDTYLDVKNLNKKTAPKEKTKLQKLTGNILKSAPKTSGKSYGFKFEVISDDRYKQYFKVVFPPDFLENFEDKSFWNWLIGRKKQIKLKTNRYTKDKDGNIIYPDFTVQELLEDSVFIEIEKKYNRIHFPGGIAQELTGIGLGYLIYEEFIKFLGYASSDKQMSSDDAKNVWSKIAKDPDFYCIVVHSSDEFTNSKIMAIAKSHTIASSSHKNKLDKIIFSFLRDHLLEYGNKTRLRVDEDLEKKLPYLTTWKEIYEKGFTLDDWIKELSQVSDKLIESNKSTKDFNFNQYEKLSILINSFRNNVINYLAFPIKDLENHHQKFEAVYNKLIKNFDNIDEETQNKKHKIFRLVNLLETSLKQILYERDSLGDLKVVQPIGGELQPIGGELGLIDLSTTNSNTDNSLEPINFQI